MNTHTSTNTASDMSTPQNLLLIPHNFPGKSVTESTFILPEIEPLTAQFSRVIIAPESGSASDADPRLLQELERKGVTVDFSLTRRPGIGAKISSLLSPHLWKSLFKSHIRSLTDLRSDMAETAYTLHYRALISSLLSKYNLHAEDTIIYTFWFNHTTNAAALQPRYPVVTRCHGYDVYESEYYHSSYWRSLAFSQMQGCYAASRNAANYLRTLYPEFSSKIHTAYLGIETDGIEPAARVSDAGKISFASSARMEPVKRIPLMARSVMEYARRHPETQVSWTHYGDGSERAKVESVLADKPQNLEVNLQGETPNATVRKGFASGRYDMVLLTSRSEGGTPFALMEGMAAGLPVIVTNVGGVPELVSSDCGILLPKEFDYDDFCRAVERVSPHRDAMGAAARQRIHECFDAAKLREEFAIRLCGV